MSQEMEKELMEQDVQLKSGEVEMYPTFNRVIVKVEENPYIAKKTKSGIIIPDVVHSNKSGKLEEGKPYVWYVEVVEIGPEVTTLKPGDGLYISPHAGYPIDFYDTQLLVIRDQDAIVIFRKDGK